jgi:acetolactate synthase-1/2/3 large subunit
MKLSDYVINFLAERGVTHVFGMSGGAAVHLFDSIARHPAIDYVCSTHEQCSAMSADGYARASGRLGVALTTSGPGATNLLTGVCCSYYDSVPALMLTGQVATHRLKGDRQVRQIGFQETDVLAIFKTVTKYAVQISDPLSIRYHLEKAYHLAFEGRPGPVLIDIPDDLQRVEVNPEELQSFVPEDIETSRLVLTEQIEELLKCIDQAERPVLVLGAGLKTPWVGDLLHSFLEYSRIPALLTWAGIDLLPANHPLRVGPFGVYGPRHGNFTVQNADLIIALGTRLSQNLTGGVLPAFAREAKIAMVDVDVHELTKFDGRGIDIQIPVCARLAEFFAVINPQLKNLDLPDWAAWKAKIAHWKTALPEVSISDARNRGWVDAYEFVEILSHQLDEDEIIYVDTGGNLTWTCNGLHPKARQSVHSAWNNTPMGYALPGAIGGCCFNNKRPNTCIIGDGGLMLCLGELATLVKHQLPIKVVLFNNHCHGIQRQTLETWLDANYVGVDPESGLAFPDFVQVAKAMGLKVVTIDNVETMAKRLKDAYSQAEPIFINVEINPNQKLYPVVKFGFPLENQMPLLDQSVIEAEMITEPYKTQQ